MSQEAQSLSRLSVYLKGDDICPEQISKLVGFEPTTGHRKGETWITSSNRKVVEKTGLWSWTLSIQSADVGDALAEFLLMFPEGVLLGNLPGVEEAYFDVFMANEANCSGGGDGNIVIDPKTLIRLAALALPLQVTLAVVKE